MAEVLDFSAFPASKRLERIAEESAKGNVIRCGWVPPDERTDEQNAAASAITDAMPRFHIRGHYRMESRRYALWKAARSLLGHDPHWINQVTGSCVGAGAGNMTMVSKAVDIHVSGLLEQWRWPFWLYTYGRSRHHAGLRGRGEGSFGSAWAKAAVEDGIFELDPAGEPDLPDPTIRNGWAVHPAELELQWSDGARIAANWLRVGKSRLFKTAAPLRSADDVAAALANGYPCTMASMFGFSPMVPPVEGRGENQVRLVRRWNAQWAHQMCILEFWDHPDLGPIFGCGNQWGAKAHGEPPSDYPNVLYYVTFDLLDTICRRRDSEFFAFSGHTGFPAREAELRFDAF